MSGANPPVAKAGGWRWSLAVERDIRLAAGLVLMLFVTTHLINHAVGVLGVDAMVEVAKYRTAIWRSWFGTVFLYGAFIVHPLLAVKRIVSRRTWRMPWVEAAQILLGLAIPLLLIDHVVGTRYLSEFHGTRDTYFETLVQLYPTNAFKQILLLLVVWAHGVIGIGYAFRSRAWYFRVRDPGLVLAFLVPLLAIAGFLAGAREALEFDTPTAVWTPLQRAQFVLAVENMRIGLGVAGIVLAGVMVGIYVYRRLRPRVVIRYRGHGEVEVPVGLTLLEASRSNSVPHPSHCGGRGRCSSCRVLVVEGHDRLPPPGPIETQMLKRISAPQQVRLACQIRPQRDLAVQILLPITAAPGKPDWEEEAYKWGVERLVTVLFVDVRGFTHLSRSQLPADLVVILNRVLGELTQSIEGHGGRVAMYLSDGVMAVFGLGAASRTSGARSAINAARDLLLSIEALDKDLASALPMPLRIGIGIHTGPAVIARVGDSQRGFSTTALGETVSIAAGLESATKELLADCVISARTINASGLAVTGHLQRQIAVPGVDETIACHVFADAAALGVLRRGSKRGAREEAGQPAPTADATALEAAAPQGIAS